MPMKIAYIGAGNFTNKCMLPQLAYHDLDLAAICDLDEAKAQRAQKQYEFGEAYTDFREMLDRTQPDAVFCVGGPKVHYSVGMEVLDRSLPLYIQKSPAPTSAMTREMAELATRKGVVCHVGFNLRTSPTVNKAREIIQTQEFGTPLMAILRYGLCGGATMEDVVMDQHCHFVDLATLLMGKIKDLTVFKSGLRDARDYVVALQFQSGAVGTLNFTSGQGIEKEFSYFEVTGNGTTIYSHGCTDLVWQRPLKKPWWDNLEPDHVFTLATYGKHLTLERNGYISDVGNFLAAVRGEAADKAPISEAVETMELCEEILRQLHARDPNNSSE